MPKSIEQPYFNRMFPFEFFDELSQQLKTRTLMNPAFMLKGLLKQTKDEQKALYEKANQDQNVQTLMGNNLLDIEPFGELLILAPCCEVEHLESAFSDDEFIRSQVPLSFIVGQLYDSSNQPVFAKDVSEQTIQQIPEVLWDDPNLLLAIVTMQEDGAQVAVLKIPPNIEDRLVESIDEEPEETQNE